MAHALARDAACAKRKPERGGALAVEAALVYPVLLVVILGIIVGGMGVFRHQQVACLAREAARWASVRGSDWEKETDKDAPTQDDILKQAVHPLAAGMDTSAITLQVQWINRATGEVVEWDKSPKHPRSPTVTNDYVTNSLRVTITYQWSPSWGFATLTLKSVCEVPMTF